MGVHIKITLNDKVILKGGLLDTPAAEAIKACIPFKIRFNRWGKELYGVLDKEVVDFSDKEQDVMDKGDVAFHKESKWFCIFWGPTPCSVGDNKPKAAVPVCKIGNVSGDWGAVEKLAESVDGVVEIDQD